MDLSASSRLSQHPLFAGVAPQTVEAVSAHARDVAFEAGRPILSEGGVAGTLYLLQSGKVALSTRAPGKGNLLVQTLGPGEVLGLSWLFPPFQWRFDAYAVEPVEAVAIDGPGLRSCLEDDPPFGYQLLKRITPLVLDRLQQTRVRLLDLYNESSHGNDER
jgi:CRP-like cAMP-binding protein